MHKQFPATQQVAPEQMSWVSEVSSRSEATGRARTRS